MSGGQEQKIYAVQRGDGLIKIGYSASLSERLSKIAKSHGPLDVLKVINGTLRRERVIHTALKQHNEFGEWFRPTSDVLSYLRSLPDGPVVRKREVSGPSSSDGYENAAISEVADAATKLYALCYKRSGRSSDKAFEIVSEATGISPRVFRRLMNSERTSPTLSAYRRIKDAYLAECERMLDELRREFAAELERDEANVVASLREKLQAKKEQAR